jgi:hypothetical protein
MNTRKASELLTIRIPLRIVVELCRDPIQRLMCPFQKEGKPLIPSYQFNSYGHCVFSHHTPNLAKPW